MASRRRNASIVGSVIGTSIIVSIVVLFLIFQPPPAAPPSGKYVRAVREATNYSTNDFIDNFDGTITDRATGLMWMANDSGTALNWSDALAYAENLNNASHTDWRLPNPKELQSIIDYQYAPDSRNPLYVGPAINTTFFNLTETESWFWTGTTLLENGQGIYFCFGIASAYNSTAGDFSMNAHGAGAQRSDPKDGDPGAYPQGWGPQADQIRIFNYVRAVRDAPVGPTNYKIVDTGQTLHYGDGDAPITPPSPGQEYYGQDAMYTGIQPSYQDNGDGTITDLNTLLIWQKTPNYINYEWDDAVDYAGNLTLAGQTDWRLPNIKELYSLIMFYGDIRTLTPYINTTYFDFQYPDTSTGARIIDAQYWSSNRYEGYIMNNQLGAFGVNFADGRIKCYPLVGV